MEARESVGARKARRVGGVRLGQPTESPRTTRARNRKNKKQKTRARPSVSRPFPRSWSVWGKAKRARRFCSRKEKKSAKSRARCDRRKMNPQATVCEAGHPPHGSAGPAQAADLEPPPGFGCVRRANWRINPPSGGLGSSGSRERARGCPRVRARGGARARRDARFAPGIEKDVSRARKDARDRGRRAWDTHLFRGEVGVSEPNQDSQERVVRPFVVAVDFAYALEEAVPAPDGGLVRVRLRSRGWEGGSGRRSVPRRARFAPRSASASLRTRAVRRVESEKRGKKDATGASALVSFQASRERARSRAAGGEPRRARRAKKNRRSRLSRDARGRAGRRRTFCSSSFTCCSALNLYGCGGWVGDALSVMATAIKKPAERGRMRAPRAFLRPGDARSSRSSRALRPRDRHARAVTKTAPRAGRARRGLRRRTGRMGKPRVRRTSRRRGVSSARVPLGGSC